MVRLDSVFSCEISFNLHCLLMLAAALMGKVWFACRVDSISLFIIWTIFKIQLMQVMLEEVNCVH